MIGELQFRDGRRQIAQLRFVERDDVFDLELVLVVSSERGRGLGTQLVERLLVLADAADKAILTTARPIGSLSTQSIERLTRYYERLGFTVVERGVSSVGMRRESRSGRFRAAGRAAEFEAESEEVREK